jgi:GTP pyrophosphokinase
MKKQSKLAYTDTGAINIESWLNNIGLERQSNQALLREACILAQFTGEELMTPNGESCLHQGLAMAEILADLNSDDETLAAAILYSSAQNADLSLHDISEHVSPEVAKLIRGARQMNAIHTLHGKLTQKAHQAATIDNLRKMLLAMVDDVRVVFIKLAERLCILKNILSVEEDQIKKIAHETMNIYAPLANRLGIGHLKWQLEDLSFRYLEPENYHTLSRGLKERRTDREHYVEQMIGLLEKELQAAEIVSFDVTGRAKHIFSIYKKMERKRVSLHEIYDALAFRILVSDLDDCYSALSVIHSLWERIPNEFDDYISQPKSNGYRSIHTAVIGPEKKHLEIQIRTFEMHREAELGVAAHWVYKEGSQKETRYEEKIAWLRQVIDWQKEVTKDKSELKEIFSNLFEDRIYVFTPNGDVIDLPFGSTPLDFAYQIHSELGHHCKGAKVNGVIVPLTHALRSGEKIEILTGKQGHPSRDWLNPHLGYLKTSRAKAKVLNWFRKQDHDRNLVEGHEMLEKELKRQAIRELSFDDLAASLNFKAKEEMFLSIGRGDLRLHNVLLAAQMLTQRKTSEGKSITPQEVAKLRTIPTVTDIVIEGVGNLLTYVARCCKPIPGDQIVGYITIGKGVSVHRVDCQNIQERASLHPDRKIQVSWGQQEQKRYPVDLSVVAYDLPDLLQNITALLANERVPVITLNAIPNRKNHTISVHITLEVGSLQPLSRVQARISQVQGVISVNRE